VLRRGVEAWVSDAGIRHAAGAVSEVWCRHGVEARVSSTQVSDTVSTARVSDGRCQARGVSAGVRRETVAGRGVGRGGWCQTHGGQRKE
jgi:hypothetical protein